MKKNEIYVYKYGMKDTIQDEIRLRCRGFANNITDYIDSELQKVDKTLFNQWAENELLRNTIDKAIEQLQIRNRQNESALTNREETIISKHELLKREIIENDFLIGLLKGSDKE